jgi:acyl-CoA dehydrogenase
MSGTGSFRSEARAWLEANCPPTQRGKSTRAQQYWGGRNAQFADEDARLWFERMRERRWIVPAWPREYGGAGLEEADARVIAEEMRRLGCRAPLYSLGIWMLGPALLEFGTEAQKREHLNAIAEGRIRWCQGYSEPGAGSDLASLATRAVQDGDDFVVTGSKIWTSMADRADWIFCLVRTDPAGARKQEGISFLLIDMQSPGVSVRPIELINGSSEFCQTFFDEVRVPRANLVGALHGGWTVAKALLKHERALMAGIGAETVTRAHGAIECARHYLPLEPDGRIADATLRDRLARHEMGMHALGLTQQRIAEEARSGTRSHAALVMKYCGTEEEKRRHELMLAMMGTQGLGWEGEEFSAAELDAARDALFSKSLSIAGGTSEVQLNIIARRALELPGAG